jgi:hypothetical protein
VLSQESNPYPAAPAPTTLTAHDVPIQKKSPRSGTPEDGPAEPDVSGPG